MRGLAEFAMRGRLNAVSAALALYLLSLLLPPVALVSAAVVALATLRQGIREGALLLCIGAALAAMASAGLFGALWLLPLQLALMWGPVLLVAWFLRATVRLDWAIELTILFGLLLVSGFHLASADPVGTWHELLDRLASNLAGNLGPEQAPQLRDRLLAYAPYMSGLVVAGACLGLLLSLLLARWWQSVLYNPGGFGREFMALRPHAALGYGFVIVLTTAAIGGDGVGLYARNLSLPGFLLYAVVAMAIINRLLLGWRYKPLAMIFLYIVVWLAPPLLLPLALFGMSDTWLDWRSRSARMR